jgi:cysteine desulfuration protein SufE
MGLPGLSELTENFSLFDDWEERYRYLLDLGKMLPAMDDALKTENTRVHGCVSQVWMVSSPGADGRIHFIGDSDGLITRGLIAVLFSAYQDKTPQEIAAVDIEGAFNEIGLNEHLSPNRRNGFFAMVERIRSQGQA